MSSKRILSIGQCGPDHSAIARTLEQSVHGEVTAAYTAAEAMSLLQQEPFDLVLVNRVLDVDGSPGLSLIKRIKADENLRHLPVMLVSNYEEAQQEAVQAGALPGFGKAVLRSPQTIARVKRALVGTSSEQPSAESLSD